MDEYTAANKRHWDELARLHPQTADYDVAGWLAGKPGLHAIEIEELGDVSGKTLLHLQCHFGKDTLSWARRGAVVTGADFSEPAIEAARLLAAQAGLEARFIESDLYSLPDVLDEQFDIVFTSYGAINWLPDIRLWAEVAARFVRPGGTFYIAEFHPMSKIFASYDDTAELEVANPYFPTGQPNRGDEDGSYADRDAKIENKTTYDWPHTLGEVVTALIDAGLRIEFLHEFPVNVERWFPFMEEYEPGMWRLKEHHGSVPMLFSIKATKPQ